MRKCSPLFSLNILVVSNHLLVGLIIRDNPVTVGEYIGDYIANRCVEKRAGVHEDCRLQSPSKLAVIFFSKTFGV
jgi:hypothetical protein